MKKLIGLSMLFIFAVTLAHATETASANGTAYAKIVEAVTIENITPLQFGTIVRDTAAQGTVTLTAAADPNPAKTGNIKLLDAPARTAAKFTLSGLDSGVTYSVAIDNPSITVASSSSNMPVALTLSAGDNSITEVSGTKDIYVGGTLTVGANQAVGEYEGTFAVNVTY